MMTCKEFFEKHSDNNEKCIALQDEPSRLEWQSDTASKHSPSLVDDTEELCRQVFSPIHIDIDNKKLNPTALNDAYDKGLSVFRLLYADQKHIVQSGHIKASSDNDAGKPHRDFVAITSMTASEVRTIKNIEGKLGFAIYDTALEHEISHSDVCHVEKGKPSFRSIRSKLLEIVQKKLTLI
ncbi:MAG: hypothetical protein CTY10_01200 [Methylotenera sp.]|nr:MAG: hypothetical protein CTY10_01200 [Methylotenera sp.]